VLKPDEGSIHIDGADARTLALPGLDGLGRGRGVVQRKAAP